MRSVALVALIAPDRGRASKKITNFMHTGAARFLWKPKWPWVKPKPPKPPQPSTTGRAVCNARFLLREVHVSGALSGACTGKGPQMANPRPTPKPGNLGPPWPPGTSGNPAGYSRGRRISDAIERLIEEMAPDREFGATARRLECRQRSSSSERPPVARAGLLERFGQRLGLAFAVDARQGRMPFGQQHGVAVELVVVNNLDVRDFRHRRLEHQKIIIVSRTFELAADVDDHQIMAGVFDFPVGQPPLPQQLGPSHLEVDKIVGMMQQAHAVGLGITHTNRQLMTVAHALPGLPCRAAGFFDYRLIVSGSIIECSRSLPAGPRSGGRGECVTITRGDGS